MKKKESKKVFGSLGSALLDVKNTFLAALASPHLFDSLSARMHGRLSAV